jgi:hypothetical protein
VITETEETLRGLDAAWGKLRSGGLITVVCYPGHQGGAEEARAVVEWAEGLGEGARVTRYGVLGTRGAAPFLVAVERQGRFSEASGGVDAGYSPMDEESTLRRVVAAEAKRSVISRTFRKKVPAIVGAWNGVDWRR